ncbi:methyl-accepting chemotaxis protein [Pseudorhodoferax sp. Leaf274]|uniref:methyl-accepting chemotaxis protein n=1 Tax=Pseudorhodoferax sp. Leaf274 TaxID=1736318 RepID=UPI000703A6E7|nr:methyl-accepting chemotaxis protein [Pseudorhodoferax sp. Leaf274]KQP35483.1 hypothetical protein ASF44_19300 [Pseudorhodoferax sp. Leaf274]
MFSNLTLKKKLTLTFAALLATAGALIVVAVVNLAKMRETTAWNTHTYEVMFQGEGMLTNMVNIETGMRGFVASGDDKFLEPMKQGQRDFGTYFDKAKSLTSDNAAQQARLAKLQENHVKFVEVANALIALRRDVTAGKAAPELLQKEFTAGRDKAAMDAFRSGVAEFRKVESDLLGVRAAAMDSTASLTNNTMVFGGLALSALTIALGVLLTRSIFRQLGAEPATAVDVVSAVAKGDLSVTIDVKAGDRTSLLAQMGTMRDSLAQVVADVRSNAEAVASASTQIAQGNQDLSGRTEEQASALEETAASMEELGVTVKQNADNARQANQLAVTASEVAAQGGDVVAEVVDTMKGINDSSRKIADIIGVIDSIAFQTNILALNAAVEAARAGEQGRGFAVVASEVRTLAQRSAEAAKEIKALIGASVEQVEKGTALVDKAGATMTDVVASIRRVTDIMGEISAASSEQSAGVSQVGEAVTQMDQTTQQNAALVEESSAAADSLKAQAQQLVQVVAVFKLGAHAPAATAAAAPPVVERRGPDRAKNVTRPAFGKARPAATKPAPAALPKPAADTAGKRTGTDDWESF